MFLLLRTLYSEMFRHFLSVYCLSVQFRLHVVVPQAVDHPRDLPLLHHLVAEELHLDVALVRALVHALLVPAVQEISR